MALLQEITFETGNWLGTGDPFTLVNTPDIGCNGKFSGMNIQLKLKVKVL